MNGALLASIVSGAASDVVGAFARALAGGIVSLAAWTLAQLTRVAAENTTVSLDTWFAGPWRAMCAVAGILAVPLFLAGVITSLSRGEGVSGLVRVVGRLMAAAAGTAVALGLVSLVLTATDAACEVFSSSAGVSLPAATARLGTALGFASALAGGAGPILLALVAALAGLVVWIELAVRAALITVGVAFLPLGLAGLVWSNTAGWLRRLAEVITAVALSKLVIVVVLTLGAAALSGAAASGAGSELDTTVTGVAFLVLASFGLPMTLRFLPLAAEAAAHAGRGRAALSWAAGAPARLDARLATASSWGRRLGGAGVGAGGVGAGMATTTGRAEGSDG